MVMLSSERGGNAEPVGGEGCLCCLCLRVLRKAATKSKRGSDGTEPSREAVAARCCSVEVATRDEAEGGGGGEDGGDGVGDGGAVVEPDVELGEESTASELEAEMRR